MKQDILLAYDSGPFQALKSSGLDIVKNDSLRAKINQAYEVSLPFRKSFNRGELLDTRISNLEYKIQKFTPVLNPSGRIEMTRILNVENILKNQDFYWILNLETTQYWNYFAHYYEMKRILEELKTDIEKELSK